MDRRLFEQALITVATVGAALSVWCSPASATPTYAPDVGALPDWARVIVPPMRRALVIGVGAYADADPLPTPSVDAQMIASALRYTDPNFKIDIVGSSDLNRLALIDHINSFAATVQPGDVAFVYFSGHGVEVNQDDYILPADAKRADQGHEPFVYLGVQYIIDQIRAKSPGITIMILDACRVDPFAGTTDAGPRIPTPPDYAPPKLIPAAYQVQAPASPAPPVAPPMGAGFANLPAPSGFMIAFAASAGKPSFSLFTSDPSPSVGSIFTRSLVYELETVNEPLTQVFSRTATQVSDWTGGQQVPYVGSNRAGEVRLLDNRFLDANEDEQWAEAVLQSGSDPISNLRLFISSYPAGLHANAARSRIAWLQAQTNSPSVALAAVAPSGRRTP